MSTSLAYHTQGIVGFQHHSFQYSEGKVIQRLTRKEFRCPKCFHCSVSTHHYRTRRIQGLPYGSMVLYFEVELHRIYCPRCQYLSVEELPFLSHPKSRITKALERTIIELRPEMTIHAISKYFHLDWRIVKACEKRYLKHKFRRIKLKHVKMIGIDEIAIGHTEAGKTSKVFLFHEGSKIILSSFSSIFGCILYCRAIAALHKLQHPACRRERLQK